jgi:hypothetical protein
MFNRVPWVKVFVLGVIGAIAVVMILGALRVFE